MASILPSGYSESGFRDDFIASLTFVVILVPQAMAYSLLIGLKPIYGLYTAFTSMLLYPFLGSSRRLSVGPVALMSIVVLSGLQKVMNTTDPSYLDAVLWTALMAGAFQVGFSIFKLGRLTNFLSRPVLSGFISAAGIIIILSQLKHITGYQIKDKQHLVIDSFVNLYHLELHNVLSEIFFIAALGVLFLTKAISKKIPGAFIVVIISIILTQYFRFDEQGLAITGDLPKGLPTFSMNFIGFGHLVDIAPTAFVASIIGFIGSFAMAKKVELPDEHISADRELRALGIIKLVGSFFMSFPSTASFSRTAVNVESGAVSQISSFISALFLGIILLFLNNIFHYLPYSVLAAIIIFSVFSLIDVDTAKHLYKTDRNDFWIFTATFLLTIIFGIVEGVIAGIILSFFFLIANMSKPHYAVLGHLPNTNVYRNVDRYSGIEEEKNYMILRYDDDIFFANAEYFKNVVLMEVGKRKRLHSIILDMSSVSHMDSTGIFHMTELIHKLTKKSISIYIAGLKGPMRDYFKRNSIQDVMPEVTFVRSINEAVDLLGHSEEE